MSKGNVAHKIHDIIDMYSYDYGFTSGYLDGRDDGYEIGYQECVRNYKRRLRKRRQQKAENARCCLYFLKQKLFGLFMIIATILLIATVLEGDATIACLTVPIGLTLIFSKEMWLVNDYWYEHKERIKHDY